MRLLCFSGGEASGGFVLFGVIASEFLHLHQHCSPDIRVLVAISAMCRGLPRLFQFCVHQQLGKRLAPFVLGAPRKRFFYSINGLLYDIDTV